MKEGRSEAPTDVVDSGGPHTVTVGNAATVPGAGLVDDPPPREQRSELPTIDPGHYTILDEIARGGMGRIRAAIDRRLGRQVAIKELLRTDAAIRTRFEREALITARLQHPSIVSIYEAGRWPNGEPFYAMKLVRGRSLKQVIVEAATIDARLALLPHVLSVADAIAYAHDLRIIHRDLKPSNVLVGMFGETVVLDWGLVKDLDAADTLEWSQPTRDSAGELTQAGSIVGTPNYMPPEQAAGDPVDERADVYALGAMLYHVLAGEPPYRGRTSAEVLTKLDSGPPHPLRVIAPGTPPDLLAIVARAMARDRDRRYPSARELAEELRRFTTGQLVASHRYTRRELFARWIRRHRVPIVISAIASVAVAVVGAIAIDRVLDERDDANRERQLARVRADELLVTQAAALVEQDPAKAIALLRELSPGSRQLADARAIASDVRARRLGRELHAHTAPIRMFAVSGDGNWAVTAGEDRQVRRWDLATFESRPIETHDLPISAVAISHDGSHVASSSLDGAIRWRDRSGSAVTLSRRAAVTGLMIAPDARRLIAFSPNEDAQIWDVAQRRVVGTVADAERVVIRADGTAVVLGEVGEGYQTRLVELETGSARILDDGPTTRFFEIAPRGNAIAWIDDAKTIWRWDLDLQERQKIGEAKSPACPLAFTPDGKHVATVCSERIALWRDGESWHVDAGEVATFAEPQFSADTTLALVAPAGMTDPPTKYASLADSANRQIRRLVVPDPPLGWRFTAGDRFVVAAAGSSLWVWPARDASRLVTRHGTELKPSEVRARMLATDAGRRFETVRQVAVLRDRRVISVGGDHVRVEGRREPVHIGEHAGRIALAPDEQSIAVVGADGVVRIVALATGSSRALAGRVRVTKR